MIEDLQLEHLGISESWSLWAKRLRAPLESESVDLEYSFIEANGAGMQVSLLLGIVNTEEFPLACCHLFVEHDEKVVT